MATIATIGALVPILVCGLARMISDATHGRWLWFAVGTFSELVAGSLLLGLSFKT